MSLAIPDMLYGTAWKEERTAALVREAVLAGFRGIDTANQKKHYREDYAGQALLDLRNEGIKREDLFLQSKFTYQEGQDHRLPYDPQAGHGAQVLMSFESTLKNLHTEYLDSYLLHGPRSSHALTPGDWEVWGAMEDLQRSGRVGTIGVSNVGLQHVSELFKKADVKPGIVQNRCYAVRGWDQPVREFCYANRIVYQGFSLLTANPHVVGSRVTAEIADRLKVSPQQVIFRFCRRIGILPLTGTTSLRHMKEDLESLKLELSDEDVMRLGAAA